MAMARRAALTAPALPTARVPTGMPPGIWAVERSESSPRSLLSMGTPKTGSTVWAAQTPARWAAPPAAAMTTSTPRSSAPETYSAVSLGVRWAESTRHSWATPNWARVSEAFFITSQSDLLPIMIFTRGLPVGAMVFPFRWNNGGENTRFERKIKYQDGKTGRNLEVGGTSSWRKLFVSPVLPVK